MARLGVGAALCALATLCGSQTAQAQEVHRLTGSGGVLYAVAYSADGKWLVTGGEDAAVRVWEIASGKELRQFQVQTRGICVLSFSPDGKLLASSSFDGTLCLIGLAQGELLHTIKEHNRFALGVAFSPDSKILASAEEAGKVLLWDTATGKRLLTLSGHNEGVGRANTVAFSPDGRLLASGGGDHLVRLWDPATGKQVRRIDNPHEVHSLAFSPDGKSLAAVGTWHPEVVLFEVASGKTRCLFEKEKHAGFRALSFSPDGRMVAAGGLHMMVRCWDVVTGKGFARLEGHDKLIHAVAISPDGSTLASGSYDKTAIIWDLTKLPRPELQAAELQPRQVKGLWDNLAGEDAAKAHQAIWTLVASPKQALPFLQENLRPISPPTAEQLDRLAAELNSDVFTVREQAEQELERLGQGAEPTLRRLLEGEPSLDLKRRVERLLNKLDRDGNPSGEVLRILRAIEVLEHIGGAEAEKILKGLGEAQPRNWVAEEATASLRRLAARKPSKE
jgi:WD domain, G-beta repeat